MFGDRPGHILDTPENRKLILEVANNIDCELGTDIFNTVWYAKTNGDGTQVWVQCHKGTICNAGVNNEPQPFDSKYGLRNTSAFRGKEGD